MPFGTITAQTITYEPRKPGIYQKTGLALGAPANEYRISGASPKGLKDLVFSVTRVLDKDVTINGTIVRKRALHTQTTTVPSDSTFTSAELASLCVDGQVFGTAANIVRMASGES